MAIGSAPEVGKQFGKRWGEMSDDERTEWHVWMREHFGPDLLGGYARLIEVERSSNGYPTGGPEELGNRGEPGLH